MKPSETIVDKVGQRINDAQDMPGTIGHPINTVPYFIQAILEYLDEHDASHQTREGLRK